MAVPFLFYNLPGKQRRFCVQDNDVYFAQVVFFEDNIAADVHHAAKARQAGKKPRSPSYCTTG